MPKYIQEGVDTGKADGASDTGEAYGVDSVAIRALGSPFEGGRTKHLRVFHEYPNCTLRILFCRPVFQ